MDLFLPDKKYESVTDIEADDLKDYSGIIIDLDRTLTGYGEKSIDEEIQTWYDSIEDRHEVCILSNGAGSDETERAGSIEEKLETTVVRTASRKPYTGAFNAAMEELGTEPDETAIIGDTPLTDTLGGNRYGLDTIQVNPLGDTEPFDVKAGRYLGEQLQALASTLRQL